MFISGFYWVNPDSFVVLPNYISMDLSILILRLFTCLKNFAFNLFCPILAKERHGTIILPSLLDKSFKCVTFYLFSSHGG